MFVRIAVFRRALPDGVDAETMGCLACEERTDDIFFLFCALLLSFGVSDLFTLFDGDMLYLHRWGIAVIWVTRRDGHEYVQSFHDLTKDRMSVIQMWSREMCDKEL